MLKTHVLTQILLFINMAYFENAPHTLFYEVVQRFSHLDKIAINHHSKGTLGIFLLYIMCQVMSVNPTMTTEEHKSFKYNQIQQKINAITTN